MSLTLRFRRSPEHVSSEASRRQSATEGSGVEKGLLRGSCSSSVRPGVSFPPALFVCAGLSNFKRLKADPAAAAVEPSRGA